MKTSRESGRRRCLLLAPAMLALLCATPACTREGLPEVCPVVDEGELVVSELRGTQANSADDFGQYIEVYNAAGKTVDLEGMVVRLVYSSGDTPLELLIREPVEIEAGAYAVIATSAYESSELWMDYGVGWDISGGDPSEDEFPEKLFKQDSLSVELEACGTLIDAARFGTELLGSRELPDAGTLACGNADNPPQADQNDNANGGCWCQDELDSELDDPTLVGLPGTPGVPNRCP